MQVTELRAPSTKLRKNRRACNNTLWQYIVVVWSYGLKGHLSTRLLSCRLFPLTSFCPLFHRQGPREAKTTATILDHLSQQAAEPLRYQRQCALHAGHWMEHLSQGPAKTFINSVSYQLRGPFWAQRDHTQYESRVGERVHATAITVTCAVSLN